MPESALVLEFDRSLYWSEGVQAAIEAYRDYVGDITVDTTPERIQVVLTGFDEGYADVIGDAFANHALFETIVGMRDALGEVRA